MHRHFATLRPALKPGAKLGYVVGDQASYFQVHLPVGQLLGELAQGLGYQVEDLKTFRLRAATRSKASLKEEILVLKWPGQ